MTITYQPKNLDEKIPKRVKVNACHHSKGKAGIQEGREKTKGSKTTPREEGMKEREKRDRQTEQPRGDQKDGLKKIQPQER